MSKARDFIGVGNNALMSLRVLSGRDPGSGTGLMSRDNQFNADIQIGQFRAASEDLARI